MKPMSTVRTPVINDPVRELVLSAPVTFDTPDEAENIITKAKERLAHIEANGLKVCRHKNGALRGFVLAKLDWTAEEVGQVLNKAYDQGYYVGDNFKALRAEWPADAHGFTPEDIGTVFFLAESADPDNMPSHNPDIPGSLCADMRWGPQRDAAFQAFCDKFASAGECRAVNPVSHAHIYLHDANRGLFAKTLGACGYIDYITMPYDTERGLCACGNVDECGPKWRALDPRAGVYFAAALLVR